MKLDRVEDLKNRINEFCNERDWKKFHNPKDMAISIAIEAAELLEEFQWKDKREIEKKIKKEKHRIEEELADIYIYLLELSDMLAIDLIEAAKKKIEKNRLKYPVDKARGNAKKYTEL
ncbi:MAG: nucleotide pyrophosphohydrolase [Candidatus Micrarchaeota archaeon]|nr:nucleotide pyrophosphohydrolase [Candidatus Micrarchaeota archaeon]